MANFKIIKKGYSQLEVDSYIERLKNDYETQIAEQKDKIFYLNDKLNKLTKSTDSELMTSLFTAVEKARLIENSSKNIYELETKKLNLLYTKMEHLLKDENIYNDRSVKKEILSLIEDCRNSLQNNLETQSKNLRENTSGDPVKRLLSKMIGFNKIADTNTPLSADKKQQKENKIVSVPQKEELTKREEPVKQVQVKRPESKTKIEMNEFNQFLTSGTTQNSRNFENIMFAENKTSSSPYDLSPNESGFDLKEAVNPKEDLEEIMKAFDFYNEILGDENNKK